MIDTKLTVELKVTVPLRLTDFDRHCRLKPSAVLSLFQEAATKQAELMDIGYDAMARRGVFWAVVRTYFEIVEQPALYSTVLVRTWPHTPSRFSFLRDYVISTEDGTPLVRGTSEWVLMDRETRAFVALSDVYEAPDNLIEERNFEKKPRKIKDFDAGDVAPFVVVPPYSSVDMNGHVNNSCYADYPFDAISPESGCSIRDFQIDYRHEVLANRPLGIFSVVEGDALLTKGVNEEGETMFASRANLVV